jgi:phasin
MLELNWRLISQAGEIRRQSNVMMPSLSAIWRELAAVADDFGHPGEVLQVLDLHGDMIIRVGVATARSAMINPNLEVPAQIRELAKESVEQARKAFADFVTAAQRATAHSEATTASLANGAKETSSKAMGYAEVNVRAAFDFAQKLFQIRDPKEILAMQSEFVKTQLAAVQEQAEELGEAVKRAVIPSAQ